MVKNKKGNGATAVQVLPEIVKNYDCKSVTVFQRTPNYILPRQNWNHFTPFRLAMEIYPINVLFRWWKYFTYEIVFLVFRWPKGILPKIGQRISKWHLNRIVLTV